MTGDQRSKGSLRWLLRQLRISRRRAVGISLLALAAAVGGVLGPILFGAITNVIVDGTSGSSGLDWGHLGFLLGLQAAIYVGVACLSGLQGQLLTVGVQRSIAHLRERIEDKVHRLPLWYLESTQRGTLVSKLTAHTDNAATVIAPVLITVPTNLLTLVVVTVVLFTISPTLALVALMAAPVSAIVSTVVARRARPLLETRWTTTAALAGQIEEELSTRRMVQANNAERQVQRRFDMLNDRLFASTRSSQWVAGSLGPMLSAINAIVFLVLAVFGGIMVVDGSLSLGAAQVAVLFSQQLISAVRELSGFVQKIQSGVVSAGKVREVLEVAEEEGPGECASTDVMSGGRHRRPPDIEFTDVSFAYHDVEVLHSVSFRIRSGTTTAVVGSTGAGKTTLTNLLQAFYRPTAGSITIDDVDIAELDARDVRSGMAVVTQDPWLFTGSVRDNVAYGMVDEQSMRRAISDGHLEQIVAALPNGMDTVVGQESENLSAGEKQLVTVARAIAASPRILILDEATSAADPRTELLVQKALSRLRRSTTTLVITHRMATAALADQIVVLEGGAVVECGTHSELLAAGGPYARRCGAVGGASLRLDT
ncbi:ABC transporter permease [Gordonia paraffinivorans]|uniref:ABC transporter ATP-binding protein n=1 Tax=Gordonia paraffinivorans TaxID=175628 RepID=UPI001C92C31A|nr:ABC transporter ATP-binding protein [Gordonia paraffinivorans]MBY4573759.1 ABC transporter permease [Gordonia paraffinivorans]